MLSLVTQPLNRSISEEEILRRTTSTLGTESSLELRAEADHYDWTKGLSDLYVSYIPDFGYTENLNYTPREGFSFWKEIAGLVLTPYAPKYSRVLKRMKERKTEIRDRHVAEITELKRRIVQTRKMKRKGLSDKALDSQLIENMPFGKEMLEEALKIEDQANTRYSKPLNKIRELKTSLNRLSLIHSQSELSLKELSERISPANSRPPSASPSPSRKRCVTMTSSLRRPMSAAEFSPPTSPQRLQRSMSCSPFSTQKPSIGQQSISPVRSLKNGKRPSLPILKLKLPKPTQPSSRLLEDSRRGSRRGSPPLRPCSMSTGDLRLFTGAKFLHPFQQKDQLFRDLPKVRKLPSVGLLRKRLIKAAKKCEVMEKKHAKQERLVRESVELLKAGLERQTRRIQRRQVYFLK